VGQQSLQSLRNPQNLQIVGNSPEKRGNSLYGGGFRHRRELTPSLLGKPPRGGNGVESKLGSGQKKLWDPDTQFQEIFEHLGTGREPSVGEISVLAEIPVSEDRYRKTSASGSPGRVYETTLDRNVHLLKRDAKIKGDVGKSISKFAARKIFYKDTGPKPAPSVNSTIGQKTHVIKKRSRGFKGRGSEPDLEQMLRKGS
jgi:hypothetical protein